jgi:DNA-directed RNA polymerase subunit RPC12/RpoP
MRCPGGCNLVVVLGAAVTYEILYPEEIKAMHDAYLLKKMKERQGFNPTSMRTISKLAGFRPWPDEYKCACCWATMPPDEFLWDIWEEDKMLICINCGPEGLEVARKENDF